MAESIALRIFAAELIEFDRVGFRFHAFGDDLHPEIMGERHDRAQDDRPCAFPILAHERLIDLDRIERKSLQIGQGRIAGAEIVEREAGAKLADAGQHLRRIFGIFHHQAFGQFEF